MVQYFQLYKYKYYKQRRKWKHTNIISNKSKKVWIAVHWFSNNIPDANVLDNALRRWYHHHDPTHQHYHHAPVVVVSIQLLNHVENHAPIDHWFVCRTCLRGKRKKMPSMHSKRRKKHELITTRKHELSIIRGNTVTTLLVITMSPPCLPYNHTFTPPHHPTTTPPHHHTTTHNHTQPHTTYCTIDSSTSIPPTGTYDCLWYRSPLFFPSHRAMRPRPNW